MFRSGITTLLLVIWPLPLFLGVAPDPKENETLLDVACRERYKSRFSEVRIFFDANTKFKEKLNEYMNHKAKLTLSKLSYAILLLDARLGVDKKQPSKNIPFDKMVVSFYENMRVDKTDELKKAPFLSKISLKFGLIFAILRLELSRRICAEDFFTP